MVLHLGAEWVIPHRHVLAIVDLHTADSPDTHAYLRRAREQGALVTVPEGAPRSAVIAVDEAGIGCVYLSPISAVTLKQRSPLAAR